MSSIVKEKEKQGKLAGLIYPFNIINILTINICQSNK